MKLSEIISHHKSISNFDIEVFSGHTKSRIKKVLPLIETYVFTSGAQEPTWDQTNHSIIIEWDGGKFLDAQWEKITKVVDGVGGMVACKDNHYIVELPKKRKSKLSERIITSFKTTVDIDLSVIAKSTKHSDERQDERNVSDSEIRATIIKAIDSIIQAYVDGKIQENKPFHIYDPANQHLNIIATFSMNDKGTPEKITVVTVMKKNGFKSPPGQYTIRV